MLKFFRHIRQNLLAENKTGKYLKYAIGEIILVVIGILIALQINNWNTEKQLNQTGRILLKNIQKDLLADIESAGELLERYLIKDSLARLVMDDQFTKSDYQNSTYGPEGTYFIYWYDNFVINKQGFLKFKDLMKDLDDSFVSLQGALDNLYITQGNYIDKYNQRISTTVYQNLDYLATNKTWYHEWYYGNNATNQDRHLFFLEDPTYKNQIANYINDYKNLIRGTQTFRIQAVTLHKKISEVLNENSTDDELLQLQVRQDDWLDHYLGDYILDSNINDKSLDTIRITLENEYLHRLDSDHVTNILYRHSDTSFFMFKNNEVEVVKFHQLNTPRLTTIEIIAKHNSKIYKKINSND